MSLFLPELNNLPINPFIEPDNKTIPSLSLSFNKEFKSQLGSDKLLFSRYDLDDNSIIFL